MPDGVLDYYGIEVHISKLVAEGEVLTIKGASGAAVYANILTHWSLLHEGRYPLLSRYSPGMIALERDRRR